MTVEKMSLLGPIRDIPHYLKVFQAHLGKRMYLIFVLALMVALLEGLGIVMILPLLQSLNEGFSEEGSAVAVFLHKVLSAVGLADSVVAILIIMAGLFVLKGFVSFAAQAFNSYLHAQLTRRLKGRMLQNYNQMSYQYYVSRDTGHFLNVINGQISQMLSAFQRMAGLGTILIMTLIYLILALAVAFSFGVFAMIAGVFLLLIFRKLNEYVRELSRKTSDESSVLNKLLVQSLHAFKYLTSTDQNRHLNHHIKGSIHKLTGYGLRSGIAAGFTASVREPIAIVLITVIVLVQLIWWDQPLAPIIVAVLLFHRGINSVLGIQGAWQALLSEIGGVEKVNEEFRAQSRHRQTDGTIELPAFQHGIQLKDVSFRYQPHLDPVLNNISFEIPARTSIALVGESGAGKSTLVDLLTLMLRPTEGDVLIDGVSGSEIQLSSWRKQIGYVSQETVVFDDTIANNICLWEGDPTKDHALMARIITAARQAHVAHFIETMSDGYQTLVGDRGVRLSGGQRQRLFIARELFRKPNLLILDEATSALDSESERAIQRSIDELKGTTTVVIIAHRLSTIRNVDRVYVFDKGRLIEQGGYEELRDAEQSRFGKLVAMQAL